MSTVLISGGSGFIGSHLCERFLAEGHDVICVDNFLSGSKDNVKHLLANHRFSLIKHDICQPLVINQKLDAILHFACPASPNAMSPISYMAVPIETMQVMSLGTKNLLDLARTNHCQFILASTSEVYGDPLVHPQTEDYRGNVNCIGPRACYDEGKRFAEALTMVYHRQHAVSTKIIRIFNTYGPRMRLDDGRFTISLVNSYLTNTPFVMFGEMANITRSFCYIEDLIEGIFRVFLTPKLIGDVINLGNPTELSLAKALSIFETISGKPLAKIQSLQAPDDPHHRQPDIAKAKKLLGWEPQIDFATGIKKTLDSYAQT